MKINAVYADDNPSVELYLWTRTHLSEDTFRQACLEDPSFKHLEGPLRTRPVLHLWAATRKKAYQFEGNLVPFLDLREVNHKRGGFPVTYIYVSERPRDHVAVKFAAR